ncbi:MFS transporter [Actinoplanes italicus]|uniref:DHA1 family inner membrane transport protein n=1 Tax=Actinoplanes italicus TaxID=113567 RepID=A0A2T0JLC4_9ACTN|nr:MFS transporter [Actinoplanes italicus]PRX08415.1 DHA1 family inner membrane transport protein [Actinoplanes italicus]GIE36702.1 MFS transporter [Actinoplanes italicus]
MKRAVVALIGLAGGTFLYGTAEGLPVGLLLPMAADLDVSPSRVGMLVTVYGAVVMITSVPLTVLSRRVSRRWLLSGLLAGFIVSNAAMVLATSFAQAVMARVATGLTHALFWAVVVPAAAELFRPGLRGRVVAAVFAGGNVALLVGVPAGTWLGEKAGWQASFLAVAGLGAVVLAMVATLLPSARPGEGHATYGAAPDARRFWLLVVIAILTTAGAIAAYTYVALYVTEVTGLAAASVGAILLARGIASVLAMLAIGAFVDRNPWRALTATVALQTVALLVLYMFGRQPVAAVGMIALSGMAFAAFTAVLGGLVLQVAPGRSDVAAATLSAAVNVGITVGAFAGGLTVSGFGVASTLLIGAALGGIALALACGQPVGPRRKQRALSTR